MVAPRSVCANLQGDVRLAVSGVLQSELNGTAVHPRGEAVVRISEPGDTAVQLALDGTSTLGATALVQEKRCAFATVVGELKGMSVQREEYERDAMTYGDLVRLCTSSAEEGSKSRESDKGVGEHF